MYDIGDPCSVTSRPRKPYERRAVAGRGRAAGFHYIRNRNVRIAGRGAGMRIDEFVMKSSPCHLVTKNPKPYEGHEFA